MRASHLGDFGLGPEQVVAGVSAICQTPPARFNDAHWGAATLAAVFMASDGLVDDDAVPEVGRQLRAMRAARQPFFHPAIPSHAGNVDDLTRVLTSNTGRLAMLGHDTIFGSLVVRAFSEYPETATAANVDGAIDLVSTVNELGVGGPFTGWSEPDTVRTLRPDSRPQTPRDLACAALSAFLKCGNVIAGLDQGTVHHLLTHAQALSELHALGHHDAFRSGTLAHSHYVMLLDERIPPAADAIEPVAHGDPTVRVSGAPYWRRDLSQGLGWLAGHSFKVPYAVLRLIATSETDPPPEFWAYLAMTLRST